MNTYLPPSKEPVSDQEIARFNNLYRKLHRRLAPGNPEEHSLCNEIVVALWLFRTFRAKAQALERQLEQQAASAAPPVGIDQTRRALTAALRHARKQKNFAWRRRNQFFAIKTQRENAQRLPLAA